MMMMMMMMVVVVVVVAEEDGIFYGTKSLLVSLTGRGCSDALPPLRI
jgi:hypothetical protein